MDFLKDEISRQLPELDISQVENRLKQYCEGLNKLDEIKNLYVEECLNSDLERNQTLDWVHQQTPIIKSLNELKLTPEDTLKGLNLTVYQNNLKEQQSKEEELSIFKEKLDIDRAKRVVGK